MLDPGVAYLVTGRPLRVDRQRHRHPDPQTGLKAPAAGKTGTTNDGADAWFVGYTPEIVGGVWIGFDKPRPIIADATGGAWRRRPGGGCWPAFTRPEAEPPAPWRGPRMSSSLPVDPATGLIVKEGCAPAGGERELFLKGKEPAAYCPGREAPPANGFPSQRLLARREDQREEQSDQIAQAREERKRRLEEQREAERQASTSRRRSAPRSRPGTNGSPRKRRPRTAGKRRSPPRTVSGDGPPGQGPRPARRSAPEAAPRREEGGGRGSRRGPRTG